MRRASLIVLAVAAGILTIACGNQQPANNSNSNANAPAASTGNTVKDQLIAIETKTHEALKTKDGEYIAKLLDPKFIGFFQGKPTSYSPVVEAWKAMPCTVSTTALSDWEVTELAKDVAMLSFKSKADVACPDKTMAAEMWAATLYVKQGADWKVYFHQNVMIPPKDAKAPEKASSAMADWKRPEVSKLTDELMELEEDFWKTFQSHDTRILEERITANAVHLASDGRVGRADLIKDAADTSCKMGPFKMMPFNSLMIGSDVALLMYNATSEMTCNNEKSSRDSENTTVWKKVDGKWVAVYHVDGTLMN